MSSYDRLELDLNGAKKWHHSLAAMVSPLVTVAPVSSHLGCRWCRHWSLSLPCSPILGSRRVYHRPSSSRGLSSDVRRILRRPGWLRRLLVSGLVLASSPSSHGRGSLLILPSLVVVNSSDVGERKVSVTSGVQKKEEVWEIELLKS